MTLKKIIDNLRETGEIRDKPSQSRSVKHTKTTREEFSALDNFIFEDTGIILKKAKDILGLRPSKSTLGKYLKKLGRRIIKSKYCQFVRTKNRIKRVFYANLSQARNLQYHDSIFIDETTRKASRNSHSHWFQNLSDGTRRGLIPKCSHEPAVHVIGGIS